MSIPTKKCDSQIMNIIDFQDHFLKMVCKMNFKK